MGSEQNPPGEESYAYQTDEAALEGFAAMQESRLVGGEGPEEAMFFALRTAAASKAGGNFLDIGCGLGRFISEMRPYAKAITGLEPDGFRRDMCAANFAADANIEVLNLTSTDYRAHHAERRFDLILLSQVLQHVSSRRCAALLADVRGLLAPGGVALVATSHLYEERFTYEGDAGPHNAADFDDYADAISAQRHGLPVRFFSRPTFLKTLSAAGLDLVAWQQFSFFKPDRVQDFADIVRAPVERVRDHALHQLAIVR